MTAARSQAVPPDFLSQLALLMAQPAGRSQIKSVGRQANPQGSPKPSFPAVLGGVADAESASPSSDAPKHNDAARTAAAPPNGTGQVEGQRQTRLPATLLLAVPVNDAATVPGQAQQPLAASVGEPASTAELPMQTAAPQPQTHSGHAKPSRGSEEPTAAAPSTIADAAAPSPIPPAPVDAQISVPAPEPTLEMAAEPTGDPAAANAKDATPQAAAPPSACGERPRPTVALAPAPAGKLAMQSARSNSPSRSTTQPASRVAAAPPSETPRKAAAPTASSVTTDPEAPSGQLPPPSTSSGTEKAGLGVRPVSGPRMETRLPRSAVRSAPTEATQASQDTSSIAAAVQTAPALSEDPAPGPSASVPESVTKTTAIPAGDRIAAPSARSPQPARVFAKNGGDQEAAAVPWVPSASTAAPQLPVNRSASPEEATPAAGLAAPRSSLENPSEGPATASQIVSAVSNPAVPALAKTATRRARVHEGSVSLGKAAEASVSATAAKPGVAQGNLQDPQPTGRQASGPLSSNTPAPSPVSVLAVDAISVPSVADNPAEFRNRTSPAHTSTVGSTRALSRDLEGMVATSLAEDAASGSSENRPSAGKIAFQALLTPEPQAPSGNAATSIRESAAHENPAPRARIEVPAAEIASPAETSEDHLSRVEDAAPAADSGASLVLQKQRPAADGERADAAVRPDTGRKPAIASLTASSAAVPDAQSATAVSVTAVHDSMSGPKRPDSAATPTGQTSDQTANQATDAHPAPDQSKPAATAHDMRFAVGGGDQKVEVRVAERDGEVRVAVRTPDQRLAGSLRDGLPSLTAKLESAGLRTEIWHPDSSSGAGRERQGETSSRTPSQNSQEQPGQDGRRQQDDPPPRRPGQSEDPSHPKRDRKDFQWLFTSLQ